MNMAFCYIELTFENLDWIRIPAHYIGEIKTEVLDSGEYAVMLVLRREADVDAVHFEGDVHSILAERRSLFERLRKNDITQIMVFDSNNTGDTFCVEWEDEVDNEFVNRLQTTSVGEDGALRLYIGK